MCHVTPTTTLSEMTCRQQAARLGVATINPQTKFEVSNYTYYEDMKSCAKCRNSDTLGRLRSVEVTGNVTIR